MAPHSSTLAWRIPWTEEPGRLQTMGSLRVGHDWATSLSLFTFMHWRRQCNPLQCSCLENPRGGGAWRAAIYGVAQSQTRLKQLSSSSSSSKGWLITLERAHSVSMLLLLSYSLSCVQFFCDPMNCSPSGSSVRGIFQAMILKWVAIFFSRWSSQHGDQTASPALAGRFFTTEPPINDREN